MRNTKTTSIHLPEVLFIKRSLSGQHTRSSNTLDLLLGPSAEELGLHDDRLLGQFAFSQHFEVASAHDVDDGRRAVGLLAVVDPRLLADQRPQLVQVNGGAEESVPLQVVVPHAHLTKITWMIFVEVDSVMVHPSSITSTSRMLPVLADAPVPVAHVPAQLPCLGLLGRL